MLDNIPLETLRGFIVWLGGSMGGHWLITRGLERLGWFQAQTPKRRLIVIAASALLLPQLAWLALTYIPEETWVNLQPQWQMLVSGINVILTWVASERYHATHKG